jgi:crotonobetainyl-CoA:carnitine CoA-transferase CaiB-like acyl-CoA transferase
LQALADKLTATRMPDGRSVRMQPVATDVPGAARAFDFAPKYGQHTTAVLREAGVDADEIMRLADGGAIPRQTASALA